MKHKRQNSFLEQQQDPDTQEITGGIVDDSGYFINTKQKKLNLNR